MNEQERLQRIIDILADNAHEMCAIDGDSKDIILDANMDGVQTVAREICNVFIPTPKDTRSKREQLLDAQFACMGVKPRVYHFTENIEPFNAITIVDENMKRKTLRIVIDDVFKREYLWMRKNAPTTRFIYGLQQDRVYGVAICNKYDVFNKRYGRNKAKGKLMQHLLEEEK